MYSARLQEIVTSGGFDTPIVPSIRSASVEFTTVTPAVTSRFTSTNQPGHHVEWPKLLCLLAEHCDAGWLTGRAVDLFETAVEPGRDDEHGGFSSTVDRAGDQVVADEYGWPMAEAVGATALLGRIDDRYRDPYDRLWRHVRTHLLTTRFGNL